MTGGPRLGVDTGGTFTDAVAADGSGGFRVVKEPTTQRRPEQAVLRCARALTGGGPAEEVVHGTTHATNALLTGRVGRAVFVTSSGFADLLAIGRQDRAGLFELEPRARRAPLPRRLIVEDGADAAAVVRAVLQRRPAAVAICLLHAFRPGPAQRRERVLAAALRRALGPAVPVFASHRLAPEAREVERGATAWAHAALAPVVGPALRELAERLRAEHGAGLRVMRSDGGTASARAAAAEPAQLALSGPAAGLCAARALADARGDGAILTFDMGGTSTDVALLPPGETPLAPLTVGGLGLLVRGLPVHTVGTGGGSYAWRDAAGALEVGPESAGAQPGPACYGRGGARPTVSDAHLACGRLHADFFLGGGFALDAERAAEALRSIRAAPAQVLEIATAGMERALRRASLGEGWDPRSLTLYAFGGAGGLHACWLAARLGIPRVLIPPLPGAFCALGLLAAPPRRTLVRAVHAEVPVAAAARRALFRGLEEQARAELAAEGVPARLIRLRRILELRGAGQDAVFALPDGPDPAGRFHREHRRRFGYTRTAQPVTLVAARVQADGPSDNPFRPAARARAHRPAPLLRAPALLPESGRAGTRARSTAWFRREELAPGAILSGPALIGEYSGTTVLPAGWSARVDRYGALELRPA